MGRTGGAGHGTAFTPARISQEPGSAPGGSASSRDPFSSQRRCFSRSVVGEQTEGWLQKPLHFPRPGSGGAGSHLRASGGAATAREGQRGSPSPLGDTYEGAAAAASLAQPGVPRWRGPERTLFAPGGGGDRSGPCSPPAAGSTSRGSGNA